MLEEAEDGSLVRATHLKTLSRRGPWSSRPMLIFCRSAWDLEGPPGTSCAFSHAWDTVHDRLVYGVMCSGKVTSWRNSLGKKTSDATTAAWQPTLITATHGSRPVKSPSQSLKRYLGTTPKNNHQWRFHLACIWAIRGPCCLVDHSMSYGRC